MLLNAIVAAIAATVKRTVWRKPTWGNWWFALSWAAFLLANIRLSVFHLTAYLIGITVGALFALWLPPILPWLKSLPKSYKWFAFITALGAVQGHLFPFIYRLEESENAVRILFSVTPIERFLVLGFFIGVPLILGVWAAMVALCYVYQQLFPLLLQLWRQTTRIEKLTAFGCLLGMLALVWWGTSHTTAFYGSFDVIYTADPAVSLRRNAFLHFANGENDLRQPLFALAAIPFVGAISFFTFACVAYIPYAVALGASVAQIIIMISAFLLFTHLLKLRSGGERAAVLALLCMGYPSLLFCAVPEQYAVGVAWLLLFLASSRHGVSGFTRIRKLAFLFTVGSLITNGVAALAVLPWWRRKAWKGVFLWMLGIGVFFLLINVAAMRFDLFFNLQDRLDMYRSFMGESVDFMGRLGQWIAFAAMSVLPPEAAIGLNIKGDAVWRLAESPAWGLIPGCCVLAGCLLAMVLCWKAYALRVCACWVGFSFVLLCLIGWGTAENGLILYSLLFAWAFVGMLVLLLRKLCSLTYPKLFVPLLCLWAAITLCFSLPAFIEMVNALSVYWKV